MPPSRGLRKSGLHPSAYRISPDRPSQEAAAGGERGTGREPGTASPLFSWARFRPLAWSLSAPSGAGLAGRPDTWLREFAGGSAPRRLGHRDQEAAQVDRLVADGRGSGEWDIDELHPAGVDLGPIDRHLRRGLDPEPNTVAFD